MNDTETVALIGGGTFSSIIWSRVCIFSFVVLRWLDSCWTVVVWCRFVVQGVRPPLRLPMDAGTPLDC